MSEEILVTSPRIGLETVSEEILVETVSEEILVTSLETGWKRCQRKFFGNGVRGNSGDVSADWLSALIHRISGDYQRQNGRNWVRLSNG